MIQTRSEETGIQTFDTLEEALAASRKDPTIWKISFTINGERVNRERIRLVRTSEGWTYENVLTGERL